MDEDVILVTGGSGKTGRRVAEQLRRRGAHVRAVSRSSDIPLDWHDRETWDRVLDGVTSAYLAPVDGDSVVADFARRAAEWGVRKLVLLSARGVATDGYFDDQDAVAPPFLTGEAGVRDSGTAWSIVRPGWFAQNFTEGIFVPELVAGRLRLPTGDGAAAFIDADDIASVAVATLSEGAHDGEAIELTGPAAVTVADAVGLIAAATGRDIVYESVAPEQYRDRLLAEGSSAAEAAMSLASLSAIRSHHEADVTDGVAGVLGREPKAFDLVVSEAAADGAWR